jgi:hypothetical protein
VVVGFMAVICLTHEETVKTAAHAGERWVALINRASARTETQTKQIRPPN